MKQHIKQLLSISLSASVFFFTACSKQSKTSTDEISPEVIAQIKAQGFNTYGAKKINEGYLVEGDIILTDEDLQSTETSPELIIANEEHYRTSKLVTGLPRTITISVNTSATPFPVAVQEAINRYNAENLQLSFQLVSGNADIDIVTFYQVSNTLGSGGFPKGGRPYGTINLNTYWFNTSTNAQFLASVITHEIGHCIGYRHTDYMNRSYSCGGTAYNEGSAGVGAIHIPGTPTGPSANSWMLACSDGSNRPFTTSDKLALSTVY
jgi:Dual-action HEIGH metallo-peptidase